jgi:DNA-binding transcriptional LysR family regulator
MMIKGTLTVAEMRFFLVLCQIYDAHEGASMSQDDIEAILRARKIPVGNGLGRELDDLETKLGGQKRKYLVDRKRNASRLLPAGREVRQRFTEVLAKLEEIQPASNRQLVRVGMTNSMTTNLLPRVLQESSFLRDYPAVDIEVVEGEPHELGGFLQSEADFALGPRDVTNGYSSEPLCEWDRVLLINKKVSYKHDLRRAPSIRTLCDWLSEEMLLVPAPRIMPELSRYLKPVTTGRRLLIPQAAVRRNWVERGLGVAISHDETRAAVNGEDPVETINLTKELGTTQMNLYFQIDKELSPPAKALADEIRKIFGEEQKTP